MSGPTSAPCDVSILVPSYNSGPHILSALESALAQRDVRLEVLVQDCGSTDETPEILSRLHDPRLKVVTEPDGGQSDALWRALKRARGEYVMWLNADDLLVPGAARALVAVARARQLDVVHGNFEIVDSAGDVIKRYTSAPLDRRRLVRHGTYIFSGALLIRRTLLFSVGGFDSHLHYCMDYDLLLRLTHHQPASGHIQGVVAQFRRQSESKTETVWIPFVKEQIRVERKHGISRLRSIRTVLWWGLYHGLRPIWRSRAWLRLRPRKHLGGD